MRHATRNEEIAAIEYGLRDINNSTQLELTHRILLYCNMSKSLQYTAINKRLGGNTSIARWEWEQLLSELKLGYLRYIYGCNTPTSIFVRIPVAEAKRTKYCTCCLYWRAISYSIPISIISFLLGKYLP
jgi:hypothetical protein